MIYIKKEFFKQSDKEEFQKILDFASNLIIIDKVKATSLETSEIVYAASEYITAYYNLADYDDETRARIILNYNERNPYYKKLQTDYGIEPGFARESKHLSILKVNSNVLSKFEEELFYEAYYESLNYYNQVIGTNAFKFHKNNTNFTMVFLIWSAIQKYLTKKMDTIFNVDFYDEKMLKNSFISLGVDYFDGLPINYQRKLLKKMNSIISDKGSTQCFIDIMEVFGPDTVQINNYYLVKKYNKVIDSTGKEYFNPTLEFYKTPFTKELDVNSDEYFDFEEITINDKYWKATKEEILNKEFNTVKTNYISINSSMDIIKNSLQFSYFFNFLEKAYSKGKLENLNIYNTKISKDPFNLYHALIALISLGMKINGYKDNIVKNIDVSNYVYGYSDKLDSVNLNKFINNIRNELNSDTQMEESDKLVLLSFINKFDIKRLEENKYSLNEFLTIFQQNEEVRNKLDEFINTTFNYEIVKNLKAIKDLEMRTIINNNLFKGYSTYSDYLKHVDLNLYNYIDMDNLNFETEAKLYLAIKEKMNELISSISSQLYNEKLSESISRNTFIGLNNYLEYYIKTLILLFKPYSLELLNSDSYLDFKDKNESVRLYDSFEKHLIKTEAEYVGLNEKLEIINKEGVKIL